MKEKVGIALLSFAHNHANAWAKVIIRSQDAELVAIWDNNEERGRKKAKQYDTVFISNLARILARSDIDAVGICAETNKHEKLATAAAEAGKHILCEKPMATTLKDCDRIMEACKKAEVKYMQSFPKRFDPVNAKIREILQKDVIGKVTMVRKCHGH